MATAGSTPPDRRVVTRFPPEHVKSICLNLGLAKESGETEAGMPASLAMLG